MTGTVDVADVIDSQKVSRYQCFIAFMAWLGSIAMLFDNLWILLLVNVRAKTSQSTADEFIRLATPFLKS